MDSSDDEYDYSVVDEFMYTEFITDDSESEIDTDNDADIMSMMSIQEEMEKKEEHVLNFRGSIKGRIVMPRDRIKGARDLYNDYFRPVSYTHLTLPTKRIV